MDPCKVLHRELAASQEKSLGMKREAKRLASENASAGEDLEELRERMEDAMGEIDDLREAIPYYYSRT